MLIGWDAADWKVIHPLMDAGKMPNLSRLVRTGYHEIRALRASEHDTSFVSTNIVHIASLVLGQQPELCSAAHSQPKVTVLF